MARPAMLPAACLLSLAGVFLRPVPEAAAQSADEDREQLRSSGVAVDGPGLLAFLRRNTLTETDTAQVQRHIRQLGDESFTLREKASHDLLDMGPVIRPLLLAAVKDPDPEIAHRSRRCLKLLEQTTRPATLCAACRQLARERPEGTLEALLAFLPHAVENVEVEEAASASLAVVGLRDGRPDPALLKGLSDRDPLRRGIVGAILAGARGDRTRAAVIKLLQDPRSEVRLRVALALVQARDKAAVPALIDLLVDLPLDQACQAEEALVLIAADKSPESTLGDGPAERRKCKLAWEAWWKAHGSSINLTRLDLTERQRGYTLICQADRRARIGEVIELDATGKERWRINGLNYPVDAQVLGPDRVLITEYRLRQVTVRNHAGEVKWQHTLNSFPVSARRLPNGHTFIAAFGQVVELDAGGREVLSIPRGNDVAAACRLRDGQVVVLTRTGTMIRYDRKGREVRSVHLGGQLYLFSSIQPLPGGHFLVPLYYNNQVVEIDGDGKRVATLNAIRPTSAQRLPNGHTLVASLLQGYAEYDRDGKEISRAAQATRIYRVWRR